MRPTGLGEREFVVMRPHRHTKRRPVRALSQHITDRFPVELVDRTIDFLHNDWLTLNACSLVCWSWLQRSRYHLLNKVFLKPDNIREFFENVDSPKAFLASSHVRGLVLSGISEPGLDLTFPAFQLGSQHYFSFPSLACIELRTLALQTCAFVPWIGRYSHVLTNISLETVVVDSLAKFLTSLADLCELRQMVIETVWFQDLETDIRPRNDAFPKLYSLFLGVAAVSIMRWIAKYQHPNARLRNLHLPVYNDARATFAADTYLSLASSLSSLSISQYSLPKCMSLTLCPDWLIPYAQWIPPTILTSELFSLQGAP
ncbi:hypothetical protein BD779DRAFT_1502800 [Infundibulicybe gibba]|nr:hypothetical protein BD779DRAFT_1502800 [Infundibulicybe gibba]